MNEIPVSALFWKGGGEPAKENLLTRTFFGVRFQDRPNDSHTKRTCRALPFDMFVDSFVLNIR